MYSSSSKSADQQAARSPLIQSVTSKNQNVGGHTNEKVSPKKEPKKEQFGTNFIPNWAEETGRSQGTQDFAKLIHTRYLSDKEKILLDALNEYKRYGYKRTLIKITLMILVCICLLLFTIFSIGCWSEYLELTEHLEYYDARYVKLRKINKTNSEMDCPIISIIGDFWKPSSSHVDLFGKIISIISIRKLLQLLVRLVRSIRLKTTTEDEARKHADETQKDLNGLAESIIETLCEV